MATLQERHLGYHSRAGLEPGTSGFSTLRINHYAARGISFPFSIYIVVKGCESSFSMIELVSFLVVLLKVEQQRY
jgi:hypothetical protein